MPEQEPKVRQRYASHQLHFPPSPSVLTNCR